MSSAGNSTYDNEPVNRRLFGRQRPLHEVLGGGQVADILLWRNPKVSALLVLGMTIIWLLFEVFEYSMVTLLCHISITTMLVFFILCTLAELFKWKRPQIPEIILDESTFKSAATAFHERFNLILSKFFDVACARDTMSFCLAIGTLLVLSVIGNYISSLNLLFASYICAQILPFVYEKYEDDVDYFAGETYKVMKHWYNKFDERVLGKIPRANRRWNKKMK